MSQSDDSNLKSKTRSDATVPMTYQDALDEALEETFPASDPIASSPASRHERQIATPTNPVDWPVKSDHARGNAR
ncbi:hypothetical protein ACMYR3_09735 [Ampullimonas aquatilis]|uniref:hypothetical protein n=1 Tax=Ampullimonas aquatilis TaxID=1341549 RepID=UPI003C78C263